jgi:hypothetical protein
MPSTSLQIAVRVKDDLYEMIRVAAAAEGRSMSNYVDRFLRTRFLPGDDGKLVLKPPLDGAQVDIEDAIAESRRPRARAAGVSTARRTKTSKHK